MSTPLSLSRVGGQTLVYGAGTLLTKAVGFLMLPLYTHYLTPSDYGTLALVQVTVEVMSIFAGASIVGGVFRFFFKANTSEERHAVLYGALLILCISYGAVSFGAFAAAPWISSMLFGSLDSGPLLIKISSVALAGEGLLLVPLAYLRAQERSRLFLVTQVLRLVVQVTLNVLFLVTFAMGVAGILLSTLVTNAVFVALLISYMLHEIPFCLSWQTTRYLLRFGVPLIGTTMSMFVLHYCDRYFLQASATAAAVGLYALAYQFGFAFLALANEPFLMVWEPLRFEVAKQPDRDHTYSRCFIYLNVVLITFATLIALFAHDFLRVAAPAFLPAADLVPIILAAYVLHAWTNFHSIGALVSERTDLITLAHWGAAALALLLYWLWIPWLWGLGAALATLAAFGLRWGLIYLISQRLWRVRYAWREVLLLVVIGGITTVAGTLVPRESIAQSISVRIFLFALYLLAVWSLPILSDAERGMLRSLGKEPRLVFAKLIA